MGDQQARREPGGAMDGGASAEGAANGGRGGQSSLHRSGESSAKYIGCVRKTAAKAVKAATSRRSRKGGSGRAGSAVGGDGDDSSDATEVSALILPCDAPGEEGGRSDALPPAASGSCGATLKLSSLLEDPEAPAAGAADVVRCTASAVGAQRGTTSSAPAEGSRDVLRTLAAPAPAAPPPAAPAPAAPADVDAWIVEL